MALMQEGLVRVQDLGEGFSFDEARQKIDVNVSGGGGLDCDAIDALPVKPWKKGTSVLAKQDGECVRLQASGDLFTDLVTSINTQTTSVTHETGKSTQATITFQVANAGLNPATTVNINIVKPLLGNYQIDSVTHRSVGSAGVVKNSETSYSAESISSGGYVEVVMRVTFSKQGSFAFGVQAESLFDTNPTNSSKSLTISVTEKDPIVDGNVGNYQPTVECPLFEIWDVETGNQLNVMTPGDVAHFRAQTMKKGINFIGDKPLSGRKFKLQNAHQITGVSLDDPLYSEGAGWTTSYTMNDRYSYYLSFLTEIDGFKALHLNVDDQKLFSSLSVIDIQKSGSSKDFIPLMTLTPGIDYSFDPQTSELTILKDFLSFTLIVKPSGVNCTPQICVINGVKAANFNIQDKTMMYSSLPENVSVDFSQEIDITLNSQKTYRFDKFENANIITRGAGNWLSTNQYVGSSTINIHRISNPTAVVTIKAGATGTFTLTADDDRLNDIQTAGGISATYNNVNRTVTVTLNAPTTSSSIKFKSVEFKVVD